MKKLGSQEKLDKNVQKTDKPLEDTGSVSFLD